MDYDEVPYQHIFSDGFKLASKKEKRVELFMKIIFGFQVFSCLVSLLVAIISQGVYMDIEILLDFASVLILGNAIFGTRFRKGCLSVYLYLFAIGYAVILGIAFITFVVNFSHYRQLFVEKDREPDEKDNLSMVLILLFLLFETGYNALVAWCVYLYKKMKF